MRTTKPYPSALLEQLSQFFPTLRTSSEHRRYQCVWLQVTLGLTAEQISQAVRLHPRSVKMVQSRFRQQGFPAFLGDGRGGSRHQNLTGQQEDSLLKPFLKKAEAGGVLVVHSIKAAYEQAVGHAVPKSTVYRMLERHSWRKITPRPRHPKADVAAQQAFKKTSGS